MTKVAALHGLRLKDGKVVPYLEMGGNKNNDGHYNEKSSNKNLGERMNHAAPETGGCDEWILFPKTGGCHGWHEPDMLLLHH
mmetsp:Transcript_19675/g.26676  ORF Transcript_19675/g.26676 Transcript_19675/m.26676 type:complete len:82 (-) Transcript_19675:301-546(-)|eukprot:CAMPEP_0185797982 /NCGR_PEP_ID=MMETSP1174-20130828/161904_1 /TAXON_ID=35687 /ORGANISM="Dictyocha speculum, Strain CCMP1381" /LENGTH=81 /DNA_ID=CAMNT_0028493447 /DNA_START=948 /DNA_END=1193 /DNA_ORIENTATION=-